MRQTLSDNFGGSQKNMNCAFPSRKGVLRNFAEFTEKQLLPEALF